MPTTSWRPYRVWMSLRSTLPNWVTQCARSFNEFRCFLKPSSLNIKRRFPENPGPVFIVGLLNVIKSGKSAGD